MDQHTEKQESVSPESWLRCEECDHVGADVVETVCPYAEEILKKEVLVTICRKCCAGRMADI